MTKKTATRGQAITGPVVGWRALWQIVFVLLLLAAPAANLVAHVQKTAVTRILFNPNTSNIEIMHRFLVHDAEHAATLIFGERQSLLEAPESRELFSSYVMNRFAVEARLANGERKRLDLEYVGSEVDGQFLWVYQEVPDDPEITGLSIVHSVLRDVWPDQANLVNIERSGAVQTLHFVETADVLSADFP